MITNIFLGLILGTITGVFLILNSKINNLYKLLNKFINIESTIKNGFIETLRLFDNFRDRLNYLVSVNDEHFENLKLSIDDKFKALNYNDDYIKERLDSHYSNTRDFIMEENKYTRNEIKKLAKISSKIKSNSKTNKSINHK